VAAFFFIFFRVQQYLQKWKSQTTSEEQLLRLSKLCESSSEYMGSPAPAPRRKERERDRERERERERERAKGDAGEREGSSPARRGLTTKLSIRLKLPSK
jgi:hypothetical protein